MATTNLGKVSVTPKGEYDPLVTYERLDIVSHNGSSYIVKQASTGVTPIEGEFYALIAEKGDGGSFVKKAYKTYASMDADKVNIPANSSVDVTNDPDESKNGAYIYDGVAFTRSQYDSKVVTDKIIADTAIAVQEAINNTAVEGGVVDTFVTVTARGAETIARTQRAKNSDSITPYDFGVLGSYNTDTLANRFATLADAQEVYPNAVALTELADRVAFDSFLLYMIANNVRGVDISCELLIDQPLVSYTNAKTLLWFGDVTIKPHLSVVKYCLHIATPQMTHRGRFIVLGSDAVGGDMRSRRIHHGVVFGAESGLGLTGSCDNTTFDHVSAFRILGFAVLVGANAHFTGVDVVRGSYCGSARDHSNNFLQGVIDDFTSVVNTLATTNQISTLTLPNMTITQDMQNTGDVLVSIDNEIYDVRSIDYSAKTVQVYPHLPPEKTSGRLVYIFGGALSVRSNNSACTRFGTVQSIVSGFGYQAPALYGANIANLITEFNGAGIYIGSRAQTNIGNVIGVAYFEANKADIVFGWSNSRSGLNLQQTIALNPSKITNLFAYRNGQLGRIGSGNQLMGGYVNFNGEDLYNDNFYRNLIHSDSHRNFYLDELFVSNLVLNLGYDRKIAELTNRRGKTFTFGTLKDESTPRKATINAPTGFTLNGASSIEINLHEYAGLVSVALDIDPSDTLSSDFKVIVSGTRKINKGATTKRPISPKLGDRYYDTTLLASGKPIEWNGTAWVDALGATV